MLSSADGTDGTTEGDREALTVRTESLGTSYGLSRPEPGKSWAVSGRLALTPHSARRWSYLR